MQIHGSPKKPFPDLENFVTGVSGAAYHLCLNLLQSRNLGMTFSDPCIDKRNCVKITPLYYRREIMQLAVMTGDVSQVVPSTG